MKSNHWMPLHIGDYLGNTMHLTTLEHGAYLLLIFAYWRHGGALPDDAKHLQSICKASTKEWPKLADALGPFFKIEGGLWHHARIDGELLRASKGHAKRSAAAMQRWCNADAKHEQPEPEKKEQKDIRKIISDSIPRATRASRANTDDPAVRKQVWEQRMINEVVATFGIDEGARIVEAYGAGDPAAKQIFNSLSDGKKLAAAQSDNPMPAFLRRGA